MNSDRALDIIAAYGADARRWPDAERGPALMLAAHDAGARDALAQAAALDPLLADWARADVGGVVFDATQVTRQHGRTAPHSSFGWFAGGLAAAAAAVALLVMPMEAPKQKVAAVKMASVQTPAATGNDSAFAYVFTPTYDEEQVI